MADTNYRWRMYMFNSPKHWWYMLKARWKVCDWREAVSLLLKMLAASICHKHTATYEFYFDAEVKMDDGSTMPLAFSKEEIGKAVQIAISPVVENTCREYAIMECVDTLMDKNPECWRW